MRVLLMSLLLTISSGSMATDFTLEADWGVVVATCPDDKFAGKLRVDFTAKVEEFEADEAAGNCIAYVVVDDAQDSEDGWLYNEANFEAMAIAMDSYDATYFAMTGERIQVTLEVHRSAEDGYLVYNQREGDLEAQLNVLLAREAEFSTAEADIRFYERSIKTLQDMIKGLNDAVDMDLYVELNTAKASLAEKETQLLALGTTVANLEIDKSALQDDILRVSADLAAMVNAKAASDMLVGTLTADLSAMTLERDNGLAVAANLRVARDSAMAQVVTKTNELDAMTVLKDAAEARIVTLDHDLTSMTVLHDLADAEVTRLDADLLAMTGKRDAAVTNADAYLTDLNAASADKGQLEIDLAAKTRESDDWYSQLTAMTGLRDAAVNDKAQLGIDLAAKTRESDDWYSQLTTMTGLRDAAVSAKAQLVIDLAAKTREADDWYRQYTEQVAIVVVRDAKIVDLKADLIVEWDLYDELVASSQQTINKQACKIGAWETFDSGGRTGTAKLNTDLQACAAMPGVG